MLPHPRLLLVTGGLAFVLACSPSGGHQPSDGGAASDAGDTGAPDAGEPGDDAGEPGHDAGEPGHDAGALDAGVELHAAPPALGPHPFGTHGGYVTTGVRFPSASQASRDAATKAFYETWKRKYLVAACRAGEYRIKTGGGGNTFTVSEGHGYGMLIVAIMDGYDASAHALFDGLFAYFRGHPSDSHPHLMAWSQNQSCADTQGADSATDGDLDIAYALLLADRQWGSQGAINYRAEALAVMRDILAGETSSANTILVGDWTSPGDHGTGTRTSDFMPSHFKAFASRSGAARFNLVVDKLYAIVDTLQRSAAPGTGLLPDFVENATGESPTPARANWLESSNDGRYSWNACRNPWRLGTDYLMSGDTRARDALRKINTFIRGATGDDPARVREGYRLSGQGLGGSGPMAFVAPFGVSAMIEPASGTNGPWVDAVWNAMTSADPEDYYGDSIRMLSMIVMSGNWWTP